MKIALDAMGGDHAPQEIVLGGLQDWVMMTSAISR